MLGSPRSEVSTNPREALTEAPVRTLRFQEEYSKPRWRSLPGVTRALILIVAEGLKPVGRYDRRDPIDPSILGALGLVQQGRFFWRRERPPRDIDLHHSAISSGRGQPDSYALGILLGFPDCCIEAFCERSRRASHSSFRPDDPESYPAAVWFWWKTLDHFQAIDRVPTEFAYSLVSFLPCHPSCVRAHERYRTWHEALTVGDPLAATSIQSEFRRALTRILRMGNPHRVTVIP